MVLVSLWSIGNIMMSIESHKEPNNFAIVWLMVMTVIIATILIENYVKFTFKQTLQNERVQLQQEEENKIEVLKDFYDGKPVRRSEAFWEHERGATGWTSVPEAMANKYDLKLDEVLNRLEDLGNQSLVWSPAYQPPTSK